MPAPHYVFTRSSCEGTRRVAGPFAAHHCATFAFRGFGQVVVSWLVAGSRGPYGGRMVWAAMSRRAGLGSAATALAFLLTAGAGCASSVRHTPGQGHSGAQAAAAKPQPAVVRLPRVRGALPWPVTLRTADGMFVIVRDGAIRWLGPARPARAQAGHPAGFVWVNRSAGTWAMMRDGHLVIMGNRAVIWQSAARYAVRDAAHMDWILAGRPGIAFEVHPSGAWFIASGRGPEHRVAAAGWPEMWTRSGTSSWCCTGPAAGASATRSSRPPAAAWPRWRPG